MTAKEALFAEMGWAEDAKDAPGQMPLPGFPQTWGQKSKGKKKGMGVAPAGGGAGGASGGNSGGSPQGNNTSMGNWASKYPGSFGNPECQSKKPEGCVKHKTGIYAKAGDPFGFPNEQAKQAAIEKAKASGTYEGDDGADNGDGEQNPNDDASTDVNADESEGAVFGEEDETVLPEPEKVDIGGTEITAMTEDGKKIADLLARLDKEPEKVISEHEEFSGLNPDEVKEKLQEALKKLSENPATNADAKTQAQQQAALQEQAQAQQAQHEQAIAAGNELNAEVSSEAGQLDLLAKNHEQAVADIAQQIKALNGKEPETTALKNELVKENKKFEKEFQKIDPVAQNEDGTPESPDDHAKHCKANPKSNCPFLKGAMTPEQLQQLDAQSAQEAQQVGAEGGQVVPAEGKVVPQGEGPNSQEGAGEGNAQGEQGGGEGDFSHLKGAVTDEQYEQVKKSPQWEQFRKMLVDYLSKGGDVDVSDTTKFPKDGIFMRTFNEVVAGLKFQGRKVEEWSENDVVDVPANGSFDNPDEQKNQEQIGNQEQLTDKKSDFQNLGENPLGVEQGGEGDSDDLDFDDDGDVEPEPPPPTDGTPSPEQGVGQEPPNGQQPQQPFVDNGRRPGLMHKRDWTPAQRAALQELAKRFGAAAEGFRNGVSDEKFNQLLNNISNFTNVRNKWTTTPNVSEHRQGVRDAITGMMDKHVDKSYTDIMYDEMETLRQSDKIPTRCKAALADLQQRLRDPYNTSADKQRIYNQYDALARKYGLDDILKNGGKSDGSDIVDGYLEDGDENHKNGGVVSSADEYPEWDAKLDNLSGQEDTNGKVNNPDEIKDKIINDLSAHKFPISPDDITETNNISTTDFTFKFPKDRKVTKGLISALKQEIARNFPLDENKGLSINYNERNDTLVVTVENDVKGNISQKTLLKSPEFQAAIERGDIPIALGIDEKGKPIIGNLTDYVHVLLAGQTGAGKSARLGSIVSSLLAQSPDNVRLMVVDPKRVEFSFLKGDPHLIGDVVTESSDAVDRLKYLVNEQENRYRLFEKAGVRNLKEYNDLVKQGKLPEGLPKKLPAISLVIDEFGDLMDTNGKDIEKLVKRLGQKSRAAGVHLVLATQRPTADSIPTSLRANLPTTIGMNVKNAAEARYVGIEGLEGLPQKGPLLIKTPDGKTTRVDGSYIDLNGLETIVKNGKGNPKSAPTEGGEDSPSGAEGAEGAAPVGETAAPTQSQDQIIDGLAKTPKGKAGLKAIADRLTQGNMKPITVGEKVADMTKKLLDGMGYGYTEMKGADGKVTITPKPKEQAPEPQKQEQPLKPADGNQEAKPNETPEGTSSPEENNAPESGAGGTSESGSEGDANTERNSIDESLRDEYDAYHKDFEETVAKARKTLEQKKAQGKAKSTDYANAHAEEQAAIGTLNLWREQNGLPKVTGFDKNGKPVFEKPAETAEPTPEEASGTEAQGAEPAKEGTGEEEPSPETPAEPEENPYLDSAELEGMSEGYDKDELQDNAAELHEAQKQYEQSKQGSAERRKARDNIRKILKRDNAIRARLGMNQRGDNGHIVKPAEQGSASKTDEAKATAQAPAENPYLDKAEIDGVDDEFNKADLEDGARRLNNAMNQWREARKSDPDSDETQQAREAFSAALEKDNALRKELGLPERDKDGKLAQSQNTSAQEPEKKAEPAPAAPQEKKNPANPDGTEPPADDNPPDGGDDDNSPLDDGGGDDSGDDGGGSSGGGAGGSTGGATKEPAPAAEPEKPVAKVESPAEEPKAPTDEEVDAQVNSDANIKALEKQVQSAKATKDKRTAQSRLNQAKKSLEAAIRNAASKNSGVENAKNGANNAENAEVGPTTPEPEQPPAGQVPPKEADAKGGSKANGNAVTKIKNTEKKTEPPAAKGSEEGSGESEKADSSASSYISAALNKAGLKPEAAAEIQGNSGIQAAIKSLEDAKAKHGEKSDEFRKGQRLLRSKLTQLANAIRNRDENKDVVVENKGKPGEGKKSNTAKAEGSGSSAKAPSTPGVAATIAKPKTEGSPELVKAIEEAPEIKDFREQAEEAKNMFGENSAEHKEALKEIEKAKRNIKVDTIAKIYESKLKQTGVSDKDRASQAIQSRTMAQSIINAVEKKNARALKQMLATFAQVKGGKFRYPDDAGARDAFEMLTGVKLPEPDKAKGDFKEEPIPGATEGLTPEEIKDMAHSDKFKQNYQTRLEQWIDDFCKTETSGTTPSSPTKNQPDKKGPPADNNQVQKPAASAKPVQKKPEEPGKAAKGEAAKADNPFDKKAALTGGILADLSSQGAKARQEAMAKADTSKSKGMKTLESLTPPAKIDRQTAQKLNDQLASVAKEMQDLERSVYEEGKTLSKEEKTQRLGLIENLRKGLEDIYKENRLGKGNFTFAPQMRDGHLAGLAIKTFKGENGEMEPIKEPPKTEVSEMSKDEKVAHVRKILDRETMHQAGKGTSADNRAAAVRLVNAIAKKDADALAEELRLANTASRKAFKELTGVELPNTAKGTLEAIDQHCGISPEKRVEMNKKKEENKKKAAEEEAQKKVHAEAAKKSAEARQLKKEDDAFQAILNDNKANKFYNAAQKKKSLPSLMKEGWRFEVEPSGAVGFWNKDGEGYYFTKDMQDDIPDFKNFVAGAIRYGKELDSGTTNVEKKPEGKKEGTTSKGSKFASEVKSSAFGEAEDIKRRGHAKAQSLLDRFKKAKKGVTKDEALFEEMLWEDAVGGKEGVEEDQIWQMVFDAALYAMRDA